MKKNIYDETIRDFGDEWDLYRYSNQNEEVKKIFDEYFDIFPWEKENLSELECLDLGCGTGRWSKILSKYVKNIMLIDPSKKAIKISEINLSQVKNVNFMNSKFEDADFKNSQFDFVFSLGVLHHMENISGQLQKIHQILKDDGFALIYLYYRFDNENIVFKSIWKIVDILRRIISKLPFSFKKIICFLIASLIYLPISKFYQILTKLRFNISKLPLSYYVHKNFYVMKTDALDRFGTKIENRYLKNEIQQLLTDAGFKKVKFSNRKPYWHLIAYK